MGKEYNCLLDEHIAFIRRQHLFFVATADRFGSINLSPKGLDTFRILNPHQVLWLNLTGSGNETAPHVFNHDRMTVMFCSFDADPLILRIYGKAVAYHGQEPEWQEWIGSFAEDPGARQLFLLNIESVRTSCGFGVPMYQFLGQRKDLPEWSSKLGEDGVQEYWRKHNQMSVDGVGTRIVALKKLDG